MKANELRIGNWYDHYGTYLQTTPSTILEVWESERLWCKPIPITPEVLEKCGFALHSESSYWKVFRLPNGFHICIWVNDRPLAGFEEKGVCYYGDDYTPIKHLHQLQNLYFALTGKELEYKP